MAKAIGSRGSWFAIVGDESLPCVHQHWWKNGFYNDPYARPGDPQFEELVSAIQTGKRVIMTTDTVLNGGRNFERTGYVAIFAVDNIVFDNEGLRFRFVSREQSLS